MAGEFGWRSESRCVTPFLLKPITMLQDENRSFGCQMKSPRRIARAFHWLQMRLKAEGGEHAVDVRRAVVSKLPLLWTQRKDAELLGCTERVQ